MTEKDLNRKGIVPKWDSDKTVNVSEWDIDQGNNRIYNISQTYQREYSKLLSGEPKENVELYDRFLKRMRFEGISVVRRLNYLRALNVLKGVRGCKALESLSKADIEAFLDYISRYSRGTIQIRFYSLKKFLKFLGKLELVEGITIAKVKDIKVKAGDLLTREELAKLVDAAYTARGRAFLMMLYESGARIGELLNIKLIDLDFDPEGVLVTIDGKTGRRRIRLVESAEYLRKWVSIARKDNQTYLWFGPDGEPSKYAATLKFLRKTVKKAGLKKHVYPHLFRHSRASELAQKLKESQLRAFMGWGAASDMPRVYIHLTAQDLDRAILDLYKTDTKTEGEPLDEIKDFYMFYKKMKAIS